MDEGHNNHNSILTAIFVEDIGAPGKDKYLTHLISVCHSIQYKKQQFQNQSIDNKLKLLKIYQFSVLSQIDKISNQIPKVQVMNKKIKIMQSPPPSINQLKKRKASELYTNLGFGFEKMKFDQLKKSYQHKITQATIKVDSIIKYRKHSRSKHNSCKITPRNNGKIMLSPKQQHFSKVISPIASYSKNFNHTFDNLEALKNKTEVLRVMKNGGQNYLIQNNVRRQLKFQGETTFRQHNINFFQKQTGIEQKNKEMALKNPTCISSQVNYSIGLRESDQSLKNSANFANFQDPYTPTFSIQPRF